MSFFLTDSQEDELNLFLDEQNRKMCEEQLESNLLPDDLAEIVKKSVEAGSPLPAFDPIVGYYTISFTPCSDGNRIYAHHHLTNKSLSLCDPARDDVNLDISDINALQQESKSENLISTDDVELEKFLRATALSVYHPVGTCKMGLDSTSVVDPELRVHGVEGLRVADASILPQLISGNTNAICNVIGVKCADMVERN